MQYKKGIYQYKDGYYQGVHAVKIIGWGKQGNLDYWVVANSWGTSWGEDGFFRIAFGECGIDDTLVVGCIPEIKKNSSFEAIFAQ